MANNHDLANLIYLALKDKIGNVSISIIRKVLDEHNHAHVPTPHAPTTEQDDTTCPHCHEPLDGGSREKQKNGSSRI